MFHRWSERFNLSGQADMKLVPREKIKLLKSPVIEDETPAEGYHQGNGDDLLQVQALSDRKARYEDVPQFQRHEDADLLELFYDLFFTANYTVFSETQNTSSPERVKAYIGYFCLLWMTWILSGFYDVRYLTDSWFERAAKGVHLGVMVGFAVVAPHFDPEDQNAQTFRTMSLILCVSRIALAVEYGSVVWYVRKFKRAQKGLYVQIGLHIFAAIVYLGVTFSFVEGQKHGRGFVAWYLLSVIEAVATLLISNWWPVLSFTETHLMKRLSLLTVIFLGDGVAALAKNVVVIVEAPDAWNSVTIGIVAAASTTIFCVFLVYFDWMRYVHLRPWRQQLWTAIHFPFHLALVLFIQGFVQFVLWSKIMDEGRKIVVNTVLADPAVLRTANTKEVTNNVTKTLEAFFARYPPKFTETWTSATLAINDLANAPDNFWPKLAQFEIENMGLDTNYPTDGFFLNYTWIEDALYTSMINALMQTFNIDYHVQLGEELEKTNRVVTASEAEREVKVDAFLRYITTFEYGYIATGCALALMVILTIVSRDTSWKPWPIIRVVVNLLLALGIALVATLTTNATRVATYLTGLWVLPTITLVWVAILILTHIRHDTSALLPGNVASLFRFSFRGSSLSRSHSQYDRIKGDVGTWDGKRKPVPNTQQMELQVRQPDSLYGQSGYDGSEYGNFQRAPQTAYTGVGDRIDV